MEADNEEKEVSNSSPCTDNDGEPLWLFRILRATFATYLPFLSNAECGPHGTLLAHMAGTNSHWHDFDTAQEVLVIFQGPHAYITPSWYEDELSVPTWNYAVVHANGIPRLIEEHDELFNLLKALIETYEARFKKNLAVPIAG